MAKKHDIPTHLAPDTRKWVRSILDDFDLESPEIRLLILTATAWDRAEEARKLIATEGLTIIDRYGSPKAHPAVSIERDSRISFFRGVRELALGGDTTPETRPPRTPDYGSRR